MDSACIGMIVAICCLVAASGIFSATETAYSSLNRIRLKKRAEDGEKHADLALKLLEKYDTLLSSILVCNNIVNICAASVGTVLFTRILAGYGPTASTIIITIVVLLFGEVAPKKMSKDNPESFAIRVAVLISAIIRILTPINFLLGQWQRAVGRLSKPNNDEAITEDELISIVSEAENEGDLDEDEGELIRAAIEFNDQTVDMILTPRVEVEAVADDVSEQDLAKLFVETGRSRLPVFHKTIDNIIGAVHEKDYYMRRYRGETYDLSKMLSPVVYTTVSTEIADLLHTLQTEKTHMAVVVDEYGGTEGIVTLEDILEELVGEIWDEHDEVVEAFRKQSDGSYIVDCSADLDNMFELFGIKEDNESDSATVSGWVMEQMGRLPIIGDTFTYGDLKATVVKMSGRRPQEIRVMLKTSP